MSCIRLIVGVPSSTRKNQAPSKIFIHYILLLLLLTTNIDRVGISRVSTCMQFPRYSLSYLIRNHPRPVCNFGITEPILHTQSILGRFRDHNQSSIGLLLQVTDLDQLRDHIADLCRLEFAADVLLKSAYLRWLPSHIPAADIAF